jgi:hypothetical protein
MVSALRYVGKPRNREKVPLLGGISDPQEQKRTGSGKIAPDASLGSIFFGVGLPVF